jgi:FkbM family methyltransferase
MIKNIIKRVFFPEGSIRRVLWGPGRGLRYRVFPGYGWAYIYGGWEPELVHVMSLHISLGATVYDLGANYGMHTLLFARLVGESGRVYAFEPHPGVFASLNEQLTLNDLRTVVSVPEAVCERTGTAFFDEAAERACGHLANDTSRRHLEVRTTTLDDFVFERSAKPPDFIKIDIEGAESSALRGAMKTIRRYRPTMVIELHNPIEDNAVGEILASLSYTALRIHDGSKVTNMHSGWPDANGMWGTVLALPNESAAAI